MKSKIKWYLAAVALFSISLITAAQASDSFFEVGKTYLFIPRIDVVMKGKVSQVTEQEVVFTDRYILKKTASIKGSDAQSAAKNRKAIQEYVASKNKESLVEKIGLDVSYSRSEMTAIKLDE